MSLEKEISRGIMEAMKSRDAVRLAALRNVKKYIIEAKTSGAGIAELPDTDVVKIISKLAKQGADSAAIYTAQRRQDLADEETAQVAVLQEFLPRPLSDEELTAAVREIIAETGASSLGEMGRVMGVASKRLAGRAEGRVISDKVRELLAR
ncbi:GatB/YqeY domain-containing protein [Alistipes sp.]|uniref:GatB/YqeY domain-containing protein n=1 Tax=Alistipes sp. TaxID=1872444 RepID=UPI0011CC8150